MAATGPVITMRQSGRGDMGAIEDRHKNVGRFTLDVPRFALVYYRAICGQSHDDDTAPTGTNPLVFRVDSAARLSNIGGDGAGDPPGELIPFSFLVHTTPGFGVGNADINVKITDDEFDSRQMRRGDYLVALWTNPETDGSLRWHLEVGLVELT